jgi:hypothetical protein
MTCDKRKAAKTSDGKTIGKISESETENKRTENAESKMSPNIYPPFKGVTPSAREVWA